MTLGAMSPEAWKAAHQQAMAAAEARGTSARPDSLPGRERRSSARLPSEHYAENMDQLLPSLRERFPHLTDAQLQKLIDDEPLAT